MHTFTALGERAEFEKYYREQRKEQAKVLMCAPSRMSASLDEHTKFFHEAIGCVDGICLCVLWMRS